MEIKATQDSASKNSQVNVFEGNIKMSKFQPIDIKPVYGRRWVTNGDNNINFKVYKDAYDDSPTNSSIINAYVNYIFGEGLIDTKGVLIDKYIRQEDVLLMCQDYKIYGGFAVQVIWNSAQLPENKKPLKVEYIPIYKLGVNYDQTTVNIDGYWYSWDWKLRSRFKPTLYPKFTGKYKGNDLEILYVRRPTAEPFFPIPDYLSGIPWADVEGELANAGKNHFRNSLSAMTIINYNNGRIVDDKVAKNQADEVRKKVVGSENQSAVIVSFNEGAEEAVTVDQLSPPELNAQNVFYSEEAERKLIVAHSAPPVLFSGSNSGSGFSSNADEIAVATKGLYRRHINPMRGVILNGLKQIFSLIDEKIELDFKDFEEENKITTAEKEKFNNEFLYFGGPGSGRVAEGNLEDENSAYNPPNIQTEADKFKEGQNLELGKIKTDEGKNLNPSLEVALSISGDSKIYENGSRELKKEMISKYGDSRSLGSVYFEKNGIEYRVSNHELPGRRFMEAHNFKSVNDAVLKGESKNLFHKNNVEIIVKDGKIAKINKNFNY